MQHNVIVIPLDHAFEAHCSRGLYMVWLYVVRLQDRRCVGYVHGCAENKKYAGLQASPLDIKVALVLRRRIRQTTWIGSLQKPMISLRKNERSLPVHERRGESHCGAWHRRAMWRLLAGALLFPKP